MGRLNSNPVLQIINQCEEIKQEVKYPEGLLQFEGNNWQAFYHIHTNNASINHLFEGEHGHFHIFAKVSEQPAAWSHVAALSMDLMGQPLRWFMVNHWVTGEKWVGASILIEKLNEIFLSEKNALVQKWLLAMLVVYKQEVTSLLKARDKLLESQDKELFLKDKEIYLLTEKAIKLEDKFK